MKALLKALLLLCACERSSEPVTVTADVGYDLTAITDAGVLPYQSFGTFTIKASATVTDPDGDVEAKPRTPLRATATIDGVVPVAGATTSVTISLVPDRAQRGRYAGAGMLAWPPGGHLPVIVTVTGAPDPLEVDVPLTRPRIAFAYTSGSQNGSFSMVPMCVVSTILVGSISVHLEQATFASTTSADQTFLLTAGPCGLMQPTQTPTDKLAVASHATFVVTTTADKFVASATLAGPSNAPPLDTIQPVSIPAPPVQPTPVVLTFSSVPVAPVAAGNIVTLEVTATRGTSPAKNVPIMFQSSPEVDLVPSTTTTGDDGKARTSFAMPDLGSGMLVVGAFGATTSATVTLTN